MSDAHTDEYGGTCYCELGPYSHRKAQQATASSQERETVTPTPEEIDEVAFLRQSAAKATVTALSGEYKQEHALKLLDKADEWDRQADALEAQRGMLPAGG